MIPPTILLKVKVPLPNPRTLFIILLLLISCISLSQFPHSASAFPRFATNDNSNWLFKNSGGVGIPAVDGESLFFVWVVYNSASPTLLTSVTANPTIPEKIQAATSIINVTENTFPVLTGELWYWKFNSTHKPNTMGLSTKFSSPVWNMVAGIDIANVTDVMPGYDSPTSTAANGKSTLTLTTGLPATSIAGTDNLVFSAMISNTTSSSAIQNPSCKQTSTLNPTFETFWNFPNALATSTRNGFMNCDGIEQNPAGAANMLSTSFSMPKSNPLSAVQVELRILPLTPIPMTTTSTTAVTQTITMPQNVTVATTQFNNQTIIITVTNTVANSTITQTATTTVTTSSQT